MTTRYQTVLQSVDADGSFEGLSLYVPRPSIEVGGEKWRILQKNLVDALRDRGAAAVAHRIAAFEIPDFRGLGIVVFANGDGLQLAHLSRRPQLSLVAEAPPYLLPLFIDLGSKAVDWIVEIDREKPKLFHRVGDELTDLTALLDAPDYDDIRERREVQDDLLFHSTSRGPSANVAYHALGTDQGAEEEKTNASYYREAWDAIDQVIPHQVDELTVAGAEGTVGRFIENATTDRFSIQPVRSGDGAAAVPRRAQEWPADRQVMAARMEQVEEHATTGRVEQLLVDLSGFPQVLFTANQSDEQFDIHEGVASELSGLNAVVLSAVRHGAEIHFFDEAQSALDGHPFGLISRW
jgi:hypothetical protein